jgi:fructose-specific component phosphotransferase system IIB-like protein
LLNSGGCAPTKPARVAAVAYTAEDVLIAAAKQSDPTVVRAGTPAYLMLVDGLIEAYPNNSELLTAGCQAYTAYASSFVEDTDPDRAAVLYAKAKGYGFRALSKKQDFQQAVTGKVDEFVALLKQYKKRHVPSLFWTASAWGKWISLNQDSVEALADMPMLEATIWRILALDDSFYYGSPHLLMAVYMAARPAFIGGSLTKAKEHFDQAFALGDGKFLSAKVLYARYYAIRLGDRVLFEKTLQAVIETPVDEVPELTLANTLAKEKARELLEKVDDYFGELP